MLLILDTNILIEIDRGNAELIKKLNMVVSSYPNSASAVTWVNYSEFYYGTLDKEKIADDVAEFLAKFTFLEMDLKATKIFTKLRKTKTPASDFDLMIAAVVMANYGILITRDKNFGNIDGLKTVILD